MTTWLNSHVILQIGSPYCKSSPSAKFHDHTLGESVNMTMKTTINIHDITTLRFLVIKESYNLEIRKLELEHIFCEWRLVRHLCWVDVGVGSGGGWVGHYFGWLKISGSVWKLFCVGGGRWGWVGMGALFENPQINLLKLV